MRSLFIRKQLNYITHFNRLEFEISFANVRFRNNYWNSKHFRQSVHLISHVFSDLNASSFWRSIDSRNCFWKLISNFENLSFSGIIWKEIFGTANSLLACMRFCDWLLIMYVFIMYIMYYLWRKSRSKGSIRLEPEHGSKSWQSYSL